MDKYSNITMFSVALYSKDAFDTLKLIQEGEEAKDKRERERNSELPWHQRKPDHSSTLALYWNCPARDDTGRIGYDRTGWHLPSTINVSTATAWAIKRQMQEAGVWGKTQSARANVADDAIVPGLGYKAKAAACLFELLLGRSVEKTKENFGAGYVETLVGHADNCLVVQRRRILSEEIEKLKIERSNRTQAERDKANTAWLEISKKRDEAIRAIEDEYKEKIQKLRDDLAAMTKA